MGRKGRKIILIASWLGWVILAGAAPDARAESTGPASSSTSEATTPATGAPAPESATPPPSAESGPSDVPTDSATSQIQEVPNTDGEESSTDFWTDLTGMAWAALEDEKRRLANDISRKAGDPVELESRTLVQFNRSAGKLHKNFLDLAKKHPDRVRVYSERGSVTSVSISSGNVGEDMKLIGDTVLASMPVSDADLIDIGYVVLNHSPVSMNDQTLDNVAIPAGGAFLVHQLSTNRLRLGRSGQLMRPEKGEGMQLGWSAHLGKVGFALSPEAAAGLNLGYSFDREHSLGVRAEASRFSGAMKPRMEAGARIQAGTLLLDAGMFHDAQSASALNPFDPGLGEHPANHYSRGATLSLKLSELAVIASLAESSTSESDDWAGELGVRNAWIFDNVRLNAAAGARKILTPEKPEDAMSASANFNARAPISPSHDLGLGARAGINLACRPSGGVFAKIHDLKNDLQWLFDASYDLNTGEAATHLSLVATFGSRESTLLEQLRHEGARLRERLEEAERLEQEVAARVGHATPSSLDNPEFRPLVLSLGRARVYLREKLADVARTRKELAKQGVPETRHRVYVDRELESRAQTFAARETFGAENIPIGSLDLTPDDVMDSILNSMEHSRRTPSSEADPRFR